MHRGEYERPDRPLHWNASMIPAAPPVITTPGGRRKVGQTFLAVSELAPQAHDQHAATASRPPTARKKKMYFP